MRKNWILNGKWGGEKGSNPHSNGDIFSRLLIFFFEIKMLIVINRKEIKNKLIKIILIFIIIYIKVIFKWFNWKLNVIVIILYK